MQPPFKNISQKHFTVTDNAMHEWNRDWCIVISSIWLNSTNWDAFRKRLTVWTVWDCLQVFLGYVSWIWDGLQRSAKTIPGIAYVFW